MIFGALILIVLWFLQIIFLNNFYQGMKTREVFNAANKLASEYGKDDFDNTISQYSFQHNMSIIITDINGNLLYASNVFNKNIPMMNAFDEPLMIMEIKYDEFLPDFVRYIVQTISRQKSSISKYAICRKYNKTNNWEDN
jgi:hypothetical protein